MSIREPAVYSILVFTKGNNLRVPRTEFSEHGPPTGGCAVRELCRTYDSGEKKWGSQKLALNGLNACINTQTPLVIFNAKRMGQIEYPPGQPLDVRTLTETLDYRLAPGGVTRMISHLIQQLLKEGQLREAHWVALNTAGPRDAVWDGIVLHNVNLPREKLKGYRASKELMWNVLHGLVPKESVPPLDQLDGGAFADFVHYNRASAERLAQVDNKYNCDFFFIQDFQQLLTGHFLSTSKPKIFRWHVPFDDNVIPDNWKEFLLAFLNSYETIIVSTRKYMDALKRFGYRGKTHYVYPYLDPSNYATPEWSDIREFATRFNIEDSDQVILVVARMDPSKGQDRAIRALARISRERPDAKLVLVGNGTFSSSKEGLGLSKGAIWKENCKKLAHELGVEERVVFTGYIDHRMLNAAYQRCEFTLLPSIAEGFGLVTVESWLFRKPTIITERAGIVELIRDGYNGLVVDPDNIEMISDKIIYLLDDPDETERIGENGYETSDQCSILNGERLVEEILFGMQESDRADRFNTRRPGALF